MINRNLVFLNFRVISESLGRSYRHNLERNRPLYADCVIEHYADKITKF